MQVSEVEQVLTEEQSASKNSWDTLIQWEALGYAMKYGRQERSQLDELDQVNPSDDGMFADA